MTSGYEKSPDYGGRPYRKWEIVAVILLALAINGGLFLIWLF
jgi:hypothetical protein